MKILLIMTSVILFNKVYAESLPSDFIFKPAGNDRISFISQFKEYQEDKENRVLATEGNSLLFDEVSNNNVEAHDLIEIQEDTLMIKIKKIIAKIVAYFLIN